MCPIDISTDGLHPTTHTDTAFAAKAHKLEKSAYRMIKLRFLVTYITRLPATALRLLTQVAAKRIRHPDGFYDPFGCQIESHIV
jgi:hypothetical protein